MDVKTMEYMQNKICMYEKLNKTKERLQRTKESLEKNKICMVDDYNVYIDFEKDDSRLDFQAQTEFKEELKNQIINVIDNNIMKIEKRMEEI